MCAVVLGRDARRLQDCFWCLGYSRIVKLHRGYGVFASKTVSGGKRDILPFEPPAITLAGLPFRKADCAVLEFGGLRMKSGSPRPDVAEVRAAIIRYAPHDLLRVVGMWLLPLVFLTVNRWAWHWAVFVGFVVLGVFVIGGTTSSLPSIAIRSLPLGHSSLWTPVRCVLFVAVYLLLWFFTYVAVT